MRGINYKDLIKSRLASKLENDKGYSGGCEDFLSFCAYEKNSGIALQNFYHELKKGKNELEIKNKLKKIKLVRIYNTHINKLFVETLAFMFPNLEKLEIEECYITKESSLGIINTTDLTITDSIIENIDSLNLSKSNILFLRCDINEIGNAYIYSKKITFTKCNIDYYKLFLKSNFPNLDHLFIDTYFHYDGYTNEGEDLKNSFQYLPYSCPNLTKLRIEGKVDDLDFLVRLQKLEAVSIVSTHEELLGESLMINNKEKLKKLETKNHENIEIKKILYGVSNELEEASYITRSEMDRIVKLNRFFRRLSFNEQEKDALIKDFNSSGNYLEYVFNNEIDELEGYYENYYDELIYTKNESIDAIISIVPYKLVHKYGCIYLEKEKERIVQPKKTIYYIDGIPIILRHCEKPILTIEEAKKSVGERRRFPESYDHTKEYIESLRKVAKNTETEISILDLLHNINIGFNIDIIYKDVLDRLIGDKSVIYKLLKYDKTSDYVFHIRRLRDKCIYLLSKMLNEKINLFTEEEMIVIMTLFPYKDSLDKYFFTKYCDDTIVSDEIINSIDKKCDFKYKRLLESIDNLKKLSDKIFSENGREILKEDELKKMSEYRVRKRKRMI